MPGQVINDVDALKRFRDGLIDVAEDLQKQFAVTDRMMSEVAKTWRDSEFVKFKNEFDKDKEFLLPLSQMLKDYESDILYPLEKVLREYLDLY